MRIRDCIIYYLSISSGYITIDKDLTVDYNEYIITAMQKRNNILRGIIIMDGQGRKPKKYKVLIVDDSEMNRAILTDMLEDEFDVIEASDGTKAISILKTFSSDISLVLLDIVMPEMDGFDVLAMMNKYDWLSNIPVIMISSENSPSCVERAYELGVSDYISRPFDALVVQKRVKNTIMLYSKQRRLIGMVADQIYENEKNNNLMISILSHIVEFRNGESGLHVLHIHTITKLLLEHLIRKTDKYQLTHSDIKLITIASALHDIGKIAIPSDIINKPGRFTKEEFDIMKTHSTIGASMLKELPFYQNDPLVRVAYEICRWHHERWDGRGYPDGLKGDEIPVAAQIVSIADVYDALTSDRVYKKAIPHEEAVRMMVNNECGVFNPLLLECFLEIADVIRDELRENSPHEIQRKELDSIADEMINNQEISASERTFNLLQHERWKYNFFASLEIQFEYTRNPAVLMFSEYGVKKYRLPEVISNPTENEELKEIIGEENIEEFTKKMQSAKPNDEDIEYRCRMKLGGELKDCNIISRITWSDAKIPKFEGFIGKVVIKQ